MTDQQMENLIYENEFFILRTARVATGRPITKSDDEWSVALSAFWEALKSHDPQNVIHCCPIYILFLSITCNEDERHTSFLVSGGNSIVER